MGIKCPHCGRVTTAKQPGRYNCNPLAQGCGLDFTVPGRGRVPGLSQMSQKYRFIGGSMGQQQPKSDFSPRVIKSDPAVSQMREAFRGAYRRMIEQIESLLAAAEVEEEAAHWLRELERLKSNVG